MMGQVSRVWNKFVGTIGIVTMFEQQANVVIENLAPGHSYCVAGVIETTKAGNCQIGEGGARLNRCFSYRASNYLIIINQ